MKIKQPFPFSSNRRIILPRYHVPSSTIILSSSFSSFRFNTEKKKRKKRARGAGAAASRHRSETRRKCHWPAREWLKAIAIATVIPLQPRGRTSTNRDACTQFDQSHASTDARGCWTSNRAWFNSPFVEGESFTIGGFHASLDDLIEENQIEIIR